jgi:hypothetical protein
VRWAAALGTAALVTAALAACGGSTSPASPTTGAASPSAEGKGEASGTTSPAAQENGSQNSGKSQGQPGSGGQKQSSPSTSQGASHPPGAAGFEVKGGDNSVPEYGSEGSSAETREAHDALAAYLKAREEGDWATACSYLAGKTRSRLELLVKASKGKVQGCAGILKMISSGRVGGTMGVNPLNGPLAALRVEGGTAFALFYGPEGRKYVMPMAREGSGWKVSQFAPFPYPPGGAGGALPSAG